MAAPAANPIASSHYPPQSFIAGLRQVQAFQRSQHRKQFWKMLDTKKKNFHRPSSSMISLLVHDFQMFFIVLDHANACASWSKYTTTICHVRYENYVQQDSAKLREKNYLLCRKPRVQNEKKMNKKFAIQNNSQVAQNETLYNKFVVNFVNVCLRLSPDSILDVPECGNKPLRHGLRVQPIRRQVRT